MGTIQIIAGDFDNGSVELVTNGMWMPGGEFIYFGAISSVKIISREKRTAMLDRAAMAAGGGVVGGIAAGALAGGLTGPAGAVIGAVAGAVLLSGSRKFVTCDVQLRDHRSFTAEGAPGYWAAVNEGIRRFPSLLEEPTPEQRAPLTAARQPVGFFERYSPWRKKSKKL